METAAGTDSVTKFRCVTDPDAVYGTYDANARVIGAPLDISGATGAMIAGANTNSDLTVVADSTATEETLVMITAGEHFKSP